MKASIFLLCVLLIAGIGVFAQGRTDREKDKKVIVREPKKDSPPPRPSPPPDRENSGDSKGKKKG